MVEAQEQKEIQVNFNIKQIIIYFCGQYKQNLPDKRNTPRKLPKLSSTFHVSKYSVPSLQMRK